MPHLVAIYRSPTYSPLQHASNDTAILDETTANFLDAGWTVRRVGEEDVVRQALPAADLYLNMCQGRLASESLLALEQSGVPIYNRPSSVLACHRHRLVEVIEQSGVPAPATVMLSTRNQDLDDLENSIGRLAGDRLWIKRGDVHAERPEDVVLIEPRQLPAALGAFASRGVTRVAAQEHVEGPVLKFYGVADGSLFHAFRADTKAPPSSEVDVAVLQELAITAARAAGLDVFGGDVVAPTPTTPVLIDLNDWPSFAPIRAKAARAIAEMIIASVAQGLAA